MNSVTRKPSLGMGKLSKSMCGVCSVTVTSLPELPPGDLLAVKAKPKPAKIRAVSYEEANDPLFKRMRSSSSALAYKRSVLPGARYATKVVAVDRHMADGRERQVSGHQRLAVRRQLPQKADPDADRLLGVVLEAVVPVGVLEPDLEHEVPGEHQPIVAGRQADHAMPGGVAAGALEDRKSVV